MLPARKPPAALLRLMVGACALLLLTAAAPAPPDAPATSDVTFTNGATTLHGTVVAPPGPGSDRPGVVLIPGAGPRTRDEHRDEAEAFARAGIVTLIYDKRPGYSRATSSFGDLADDALAGVELLRTRPDIDAGAVGVWGHSEGGWVAPLAASRSDAVGFVVTVAASGLPADRTQAWSNRTRLAEAGVTPALHDALGTGLTRLLVAAGLFGDVAHDPAATLARVHQPVLAVFADGDLSTPPAESIAVFARSLPGAHHRVEVVRGANHNLLTADGAVAPGYLDGVTSWITGGRGPAASDPAPQQLLTSRPLAPLAWYETVPVQLAVLGLLLAAFLAHPLGALVRRVRGRRGPAPAAWPARLLATGGVATVLGATTYLFWLVATGTTRPGQVLLARPVPWLVLQLLAVGVVVAAVTLALRGRGGTDRVRRAVLLGGAGLFVPWAAYWGLLTV